MLRSYHCCWRMESMEVAAWLLCDPVDDCWPLQSTTICRAIVAVSYRVARIRVQMRRHCSVASVSSSSSIPASHLSQSPNNHWNATSLWVPVANWLAMLMHLRRCWRSRCAWTFYAGTLDRLNYSWRCYFDYYWIDSMNLELDMHQWEQWLQHPLTDRRRSPTRTATPFALLAQFQLIWMTFSVPPNGFVDDFSFRCPRHHHRPDHLQ